jgi:hypothetical protein
VADLSVLLDDIVGDDWRCAHPFSPEVSDCNERLWAATSDAEREEVIAAWLAAHQPCLFGRIAATRKAISYCFLTESELFGSEQVVRSKIGSARAGWRSRARRGEAHAFIILAVSKRLAFAEPNAALMRVACELTSMYLCREIRTDEIFHDQLALESGDSGRWWYVGANFFGAQGDGRWWKDHRIPGGIALSMNSVGHMAAARRRGKAGSGEEPELWWALKTAMRLLDSTTPGPSGRDTWLHLNSERAPHTACPFVESQMPQTLKGKNWCEYGGLYHTDSTIPSEYFRPDVERPSSSKYDDLNLTYLHDDSPDNPDYRTMGEGVVY